MKSMTPIRDLTAAARAGLSGSWGKSIGVTMVYIILSISISLLPFAGKLLQLIFAAPLMVGATVYFLATIRRQNNRFSLMFDGFNRFGTAFCTYLLVLLITLAWMIPFIILTVAVTVLTHSSPDSSRWAFWTILFLIMLAVMIPIQMRYGLALYVVADDPSVRARQAIRRGIELMSGNYWRLGLLWLRFIGWQLLAVLTLGVGFIWLAPYYMASMTAFYDDLARNR
ncbi:MAG TPA: DUF975 family protein [Pontiellaceae bacterium]|nr:DUF975 family protein [Pontiellaceae bacterium]